MNWTRQEDGIRPDTLELCAGVVKRFPQQVPTAIPLLVPGALCCPKCSRLTKLPQEAVKALGRHVFARCQKRISLVFAFPHPNYTRGQFVPFLLARRHKVREELSWARTPVSGAILALLPKEV